MKYPIFTGLAPNLEPDDLRLALRLICSPGMWRNGKAVSHLEKWFSEKFGGRAFAFESGRTCLTTYLVALGLEPGDEVLLQAYTCVAVPNAVRWAGLMPVYVDVKPGTFTISPEDLRSKITPRSRVVMIQHTFGEAADMEAILAIAKEYQLRIIEDCAHTIGGKHGELLGTFGEASFFSFGRDKAASSVFGGALVVRDPEVIRKIEELQQSYPLPTRRWTLQQLLHYPIVSLARRFYGVASLGKIIMEVAKRLGLISKAVYDEERRGEQPSFVMKRMPNALAELALHQLAKIDRLNTHRKKITGIYDELLNGTPGIQKPKEEIGTYLLRYTIQVKDPHQLIAKARTQNIYLGDWYDRAIAPPGVHYKSIGYAIGSCPEAERLAERSVNLPTDIHVTEDDAKEIASIVKHHA